MFKNKIIIKKIIILVVLSPFILISYNNISETWLKYSMNPVLGNNDTGSIFDPFVIKHEKLYHMYVSWRKKDSIAKSTSKDGINWSELKIVLNKGAINSWESIVNRACIVLLNNIYYLWYTGQYKGKSKIGLALSKDGINFIRYKNNPILIPEYEFEKASVMNPHVLYDNEEKIFKMWYAAGETYEPDVICYAISIDGITMIHIAEFLL